MGSISVRNQIKIHGDVVVEIVRSAWDRPDVTKGIDNTREPYDASGFRVIGRVVRDVFGDGDLHSHAVILDDDGEFYMSPPILGEFFYDDEEDVIEEEGEDFVIFRRVKPKISKVFVSEWRR